SRRGRRTPRRADSAPSARPSTRSRAPQPSPSRLLCPFQPWPGPDPGHCREEASRPQPWPGPDPVGSASLVPFGPAGERVEQGAELAAFLGQAVLDVRRARVDERALEQALALELDEARGERPRRDLPDGVLELVET